MKKKILSLLCAVAILLGCMSGVFSVVSFAVESGANQGVSQAELAETVVKGYLADEGELQVVVKTNVNVKSYRLYEKSKATAEYTLVCESKAPVLCTAYAENKIYAVTLILEDNIESEKIEVESILNGSAYENVFVGKTFVPATDARANAVDGYEYWNLTDGVIYPADYKVGRYSSDTNKAADGATPTKIAEATMDLNGEYVLNELRFNIFNRDYKNIGTNFTVEVYTNGQWVTVVNGLTYDEMVASHIRYVANANDSTGKSYYWLVFDLGGVKASKIRFHADPLSNCGVSFYEAECIGTLIETGVTNILEGKEIIGSEPIYVNNALGANAYGYDKLNDGVMTNNYKYGRYVSVANGKFAATVDLCGRYALNELRLYMFSNSVGSIGENWKIEAYVDGVWTTVKTIATNEEIASLVKTQSGTSLEDTYVSISLAGVVAEQLRFSATAVSGDSVSMSEMRCYGAKESANATYDNIFEGKVFTGATATDAVTSGGVTYSFNYDKLTDGVMSTDWKYGRYSSTEGLDGTVDLGQTYRLHTLKIYSNTIEKNKLAEAGLNWKIEVYLDGVWKTVTTIATEAEISALVVKTGGSTLEDYWIEVSLGGVLAERVRLTADVGSGGAISLREIRCTASDVTVNNNIFTGKTFVGATATDSVASGGTTYYFGYDKLTDGEMSTDWRYARYSSTQGIDGAIDLGKVYRLNTLKIYPNGLNKGQLTSAGINWRIEVWLDGIWTTVKTIATEEELSSLLALTGGTTLEDYWVAVDLGGVFAQKVRVTADNGSAGSTSIQEIRCTAMDVSITSYAQYSNNLFEGLTFVGNKPIAGSVYGYEKLTDGILSTQSNVGRYSSQTNGAFEGTMTFDGIVLLDTLKFYSFQNSNNHTGQNWKFEAYLNGTWTTVKTIASNAEFIALRKTNGGTGLEDSWIEVSLGNVAAEKLRISASSVAGQGITYNEIRCTGYKMLDTVCDRSEMVSAYEKIVNFKVAGNAHVAKLALFRDYLTASSLTAEKVALSIAEMNTYYETVKKEIVSTTDFKPQMSITLDENLIFNVYIPVDASLVSFTLDGVAYSDPTAIEGEPALIGEKEYYRIAIMLDAKEAAREIPLSVTLNLGGNIVTGRYSLGVIKYAQLLIQTGNDVEKQLIRDILSYIKAAYVYFEREDATTFARIDSILGENYDANNMPTIEGSATPETNGLKSVAFNLDETPSMTFALAEGADASRYAFFINGRRVNTVVSEDGKYIEIDVYAYQLCETVTYTYTTEDGVLSGSFHINAYYEWAKTQNNDNLVNLVARFWKYQQSARDYRNALMK